jgi:hypothetical protein
MQPQVGDEIQYWPGILIPYRTRRQIMTWNPFVRKVPGALLWYVVCYPDYPRGKRPTHLRLRKRWAYYVMQNGFVRRLPDGAEHPGDEGPNKGQAVIKMFARQKRQRAKELKAARRVLREKQKAASPPTVETERTEA